MVLLLGMAVLFGPDYFLTLRVLKDACGVVTRRHQGVY